MGLRVKWGYPKLSARFGFLKTNHTETDHKPRLRINWPGSMDYRRPPVLARVDARRIEPKGRVLMKQRAKQKKGGPQSPVKPIIDELTGQPRPGNSVPGGVPRSPKPQPAELDQDAGGGYNPDHTYPQT